jgi:alpha-galactosidase
MTPRKANYYLTSMCILSAAMLFSLPVDASETVSVGALDLSKVQQSWGQPQADKSIDGHPLVIGGKKFEHGLGTHAVSSLYIDLKGGAQRFTAQVGIDDEEKNSSEASVIFYVLGDGRELWKSDTLKPGHAPKKVDVNLKGVKILLLMVDKGTSAIAHDHADWADAKIEYTGDQPEAIASPPEERVILTPPTPLTPCINGPRVFGVRPASPFLYAVSATGQRPITFIAENLPEGLQIDSKTGRITGSIQNHGEYIVILKAKNDMGQDQREFKIVCGDTIALTPPMGWSSWNCFARTVDEAKVRAAADALVQSGLINHGWTYVNIDEGWESKPDSSDPLLQGEPRDANGMINANKKFPDMKALCDYIHGKALKTGIYAPRGPYASDDPQETSRLQAKDIQRFADWGFDYYKFNWGTYSRVNRQKGLPGLIEIYRVLLAALNNAHRDMVFSVCAPTMFREMGNEIGGNCWLAFPEITDTWASLTNIGFLQNRHEQSVKPGHWENFDMLVVGVVGGGTLHPTRLSPNEQYTHISLWCLLSSPLMLGCDLTQLDAFTLNLLTNDEVLDVNQDPLGKQARRVAQNDNLEVWTKEMEDGSTAVGLFNRGEVESKVAANWSELAISGKQIVRDLWRQKDLGEFENQFTANVPRHGVVLIRIRPSGK